jgi:WD40 repeat protein
LTHLNLNSLSGKRRDSLAVLCVLFAFLGSAFVLASGSPVPQLETVPSSPQSFTWVNFGRIEGHLALDSSPDGAFAPDSSEVAVASGDRVFLSNLETRGAPKVFQPRVPNLRDLEIESANFVTPDRLFLLGTGVLLEKGKRTRPASMLGFQWDIQQNVLFGNIEVLGGGGGYGRPRYFPSVGYLSLYKDSTFTIWNPANRRGGQIQIPDLTREPRLYTFSPDGHWLMLAQIAASGSPDPIVVRLSEHKFVATLSGHQGSVMGMAFSQDSSKVVTACQDGKVRIWSVAGWKLLETLAGHKGPVHWAEFSPDGQWVASAGEDHTVRIWSVESGKLVQTLRESSSPVLTVGFSPNGTYLAASTANDVLYWQRVSTGP